MRIQHNIPAMNSYRNYSTNNSALNKNLEKLSSGYKVNRAGDDAAGLAISEKMRAQITGLEGATKNAKDGISLIQTAEGALTEVHSMLNRMTTLAEQSANGTYDNTVDRAQLQKEIQSLKDEIDRIADSSNFNGLKLLDGSLSASGSSAVTGDLSKLGIDVLASADTIAAQKGVYTTNILGGAASATGNLQDSAAADIVAQAGTQFTMTLKFIDSDGKEQTVEKTIRLTEATTGSAAPKWVLEDGTDEGIQLTVDGSKATAAGKVTATELADAFKAAFNKDATVKANFKIDFGGGANAGTLEFTAITPGTKGAELKSFSLTYNDKATPNTKTSFATNVTGDPVATDSLTAYDFSKAKVWNNDITKPDDLKNQTRDLEEAVFEVNGHKFVFVNGDPSEADIKKMRDMGIEHWVTIADTLPSTGAAAEGDVTSADVYEMARQIEAATGLTVEVGKRSPADGTEDVSGHQVNEDGWLTVAEADGDTDAVWVVFKDSENASHGGLTLQIGDTADDFNKMTVSVGDMHTKALGINYVDISTQDGASEAMQVIKDAINLVSDTRGGLGALQNRLDHTIQNLGVMRENVQNAESTIRDTDVAEEMMAYTKNSILNQSAQAMLAQANQLPQGVLQLLQ